MRGDVPGDGTEEGAPVGFDLVGRSHSHYYREQTHHSTFVRWTSDSYFSVIPDCGANKSKGHEMADLEVVLQKERLLVLTMSSHLHHCRHHPEQTHSTLVRWISNGNGSVQHSVQREQKQGVQDSGPGGGAEEGPLVGFAPVTHSHHCMNHPGQTHSTFVSVDI